MLRKILLSTCIPLLALAPQASAEQWSGPYVGASVGYENSNANLFGYAVEDDAATGSVIVGYNFDLGSTVMAIEADANALNYDDVNAGFYTLRGKFGMKFLNDSALAYVTGGYSNLEIEGYNFDGWTAGLGLEYRVSNRVGLRSEYLYLNHDIYGVNVNTDNLRFGVSFNF